MSFDFLLWRFNRHGKLIDIIKIAKSSPFDNHSTSLANQQVKLHHNVKCKQKETNLQNRDLSDSRTVFYAFVSISSENGLLETHTRRHIGHKSSLYLSWGGRCSLIDTNFNALYGMDYHAFAEFLKEEIPQLFKLSALRVCFQDDEGTFIDLTPQNYHRFLRLSTFAFKTDVPKINIRVSEGASPAPQKNKTVKSKKVTRNEI